MFGDHTADVAIVECYCEAELFWLVVLVFPAEGVCFPNAPGSLPMVGRPLGGVSPCGEVFDDWVVGDLPGRR